MNGKYCNVKFFIFCLDQFKGYFNWELIEMIVEVSNFEEFDIWFFLNGVLFFELVYGLLGKLVIIEGFGEVEFQDVCIEGCYKDMINLSCIGCVLVEGMLEFDDVGLVIGEEVLLLDWGCLQLEGNCLSIEGLCLEGVGSDIIFDGIVFNLFLVFFVDLLNFSWV